MDDVSTYNTWIVQRLDALGRLELSTLQKCVVAISMFAYGMQANACDNYYTLGESTVFECMKSFVILVRGCF